MLTFGNMGLTMYSRTLPQVNGTKEDWRRGKMTT